MLLGIGALALGENPRNGAETLVAEVNRNLGFGTAAAGQHPRTLTMDEERATEANINDEGAAADSRALGAQVRFMELSTRLVSIQGCFYRVLRRVHNISSRFI